MNTLYLSDCLPGYGLRLRRDKNVLQDSITFKAAQLKGKKKQNQMNLDV